MGRLALALCVVGALSAPTLVHLPLPDADGADGHFDWQALGVYGLHVGSGLGLPKGCLNTDVAGITLADAPASRTSPAAPFAAVRVDALDTRLFLQHDATARYPLANGSFEFVFAEHFIEHVPRSDAIAFLREARRLLRSDVGGVVRLSTPDLRLYAEAYADPKSDFFDRHLAAMTTGPMAGANGHLTATGPAMLNDLFHGYGHADGYVYDFEEVGRVLADAGLLPPAGDCALERAAFGDSRWIPETAKRLDDPTKAHESLYADVVCGPARYRIPAASYIPQP